MADKKDKINLTDAITGKKSLGDQLLDSVKEHPIKSALVAGFLKGCADDAAKKKAKEEEEKKKKK